MKIVINGEPRDFPEGLTLAALIAQLGMKPDRVAVELNLVIAPRAQWDGTRLKDGDKLEIVQFVGGGSGLRSALRRQHDEDQGTSGESWTCPSCSMPCDAKFCFACGEKKPSHHDLAMGHLLSHAGETLFHWDAKLVRTFRALLSQPGLLGCEYVAGKRKPYAHPFQVFFIANLLYFLLFPVIGWSGLKTPLRVYETMQDYSAWATRTATHRAAGEGLSMAEFGNRFDHVMELQAKSMVLVMVPVFAIPLFALEWRKRRYLAEHLVFSLHFMAVWLLLFMIALPTVVSAAARLLRHWGVIFAERAENRFLSYAGGLILVAYLWPALQRFYHDGKSAALVKAVVLVFASMYILELYRLILFLTALYSV
jgi:thiamine biosynthesis protein ThiS